jgi:hypothetical protein
MSAEPLPPPSQPLAERDLWKGAVAGLTGGLVASFVMNRFQEGLTALFVGKSRVRLHFDQGGQIKKSARHRPWSFEKSESATTKAANAVSKALLGRRLHGQDRQRAGSALHYLFGAVSGALYGAAAERFPAVASGRGLSFGAAVWLVADEVATPAAGLAKAPNAYPVSAHVQSLAAHLFYGGATEAVRRGLRSVL